MTNTEAVNQLLSSVRTKLTGLGLTEPSEELTLLTAKELKLVVGKRGRDGGTFPTDAGLSVVGVTDVAAFRAAATSERELARAERAKTKTQTVSGDNNVQSGGDVVVVGTTPGWATNG